MDNRHALDCVNTYSHAFTIRLTDFTSQCKPDKFDFAKINFLESGIEDYNDIEYIEDINIRELLTDLIKIRVFPNGRCNENKGYLSVMFVSTKFLDSLMNYFYFFEIVCTASVVDANGDKRFRQSFLYSHEPQVHEIEDMTFGFEKYIKTGLLLSDSCELLPSDCLTMYMEIIYRFGNLIVDPIVKSSVINSAHSDEYYSRDGDKFYLILDSLFGRLLCIYSKVFRRLSEIPMIEKETRQVYIVPEEIGGLGYIFLFIAYDKVRIPLSEYIPVMLEIYVVADKYDIELVLEDCRLRLESFLNSISDWECLKHVTENIPSILELAETYRDKHLRESAENFLKNREETESHLRDKMEMEQEIIERNPIVCFYGRQVSCDLKPQLEDIVTGYDVTPQLDFYT